MGTAHQNQKHHQITEGNPKGQATSSSLCSVDIPFAAAGTLAIVAMTPKGNSTRRPAADQKTSDNCSLRLIFMSAQFGDVGHQRDASSGSVAQMTCGDSSREPSVIAWMA